MQHTSGESEALLDLIQARLADETDLIANIATITALLFEGMEAVDWVGFYFLREGELVLGPFQGRAARTRLPLSNPTAGRAVREGRAIIVDDLTTLGRDDDEFPARSQIAVPQFLNGRAVGLLQVDSPFINRFKDEDQAMLERAGGLLLAESNTATLLPRRSSGDARRRPDKRDARKADTPVVKGEAAASSPEKNERVTIVADGSHVSIMRRRPGARSSRVVIGRRVVAVLVAAIVFALAVSNPNFSLSLPGDPVAQIVLHKLFAIAGFLVAGFCFAFGWRSSVRRAAFLMGIFSLAIVFAQIAQGFHPGLLLNIVDVVCGLAGGFIGAAVLRALRQNRA